MSKTIRLVIDIDVDDRIEKEDLTLADHDVIDGFEISRDPKHGDVTDEFYLKRARIVERREL